MGRLTYVEWIVISMFTPGVILAVAWLTLLARASAPHPFLGFEPRNLAEAAAFRDGGALVRRVEAGEDPNRPDIVRAGVFAPESALLTPIEAAAAQERPEIIQLLINLGASPDAQVWIRAWCASRTGATRAALERHRPAGVHPECPPADRADDDSP